MNYNIIDESVEMGLSGGERSYSIEGWTGSVNVIYKKNIKDIHKKRSENAPIRRTLGESCVYIRFNLDNDYYIGESTSFFGRKHTKVPNWNVAIILRDIRSPFSINHRRAIEDQLVKLDSGYYKLHTDRSSTEIDSKHIYYVDKFVEQVIYILKEKTTYGKAFKSTSFGSRTPFIHVDAESEIKAFIESYAFDHIPQGQMRRRHGWRWKPSHGDITEEKMRELQKFIVCFKEHSDHNSVFVLDNDFTAQETIKAALNLNDWTDHYKKLPGTPARMLFIDQEINYLSKLGMIEMVGSSWEKLRITPRGKKFSVDDSGYLMKYVIVALEQYKWFGINIRDYARKVLNLVGRSVDLEEFFLLLMHGGVSDYSICDPESMANLILKYRSLPNDIKLSLCSFRDGALKKMDESYSDTSLTNQRSDAKEVYSDILGNSLFEDHTDLLGRHRNDDSYQERVFI